MRVSHWGLCNDIIANMRHTLSRPESIVMGGRAFPPHNLGGCGGPLIALCNNMLQRCALLLGAMNVNAPRPHHLLPSLKHNVSTVPTKGQFTEAGSPGWCTQCCAEGRIKHIQTFHLGVLLVTRVLVFISCLFIYAGERRLRANLYSQLTRCDGHQQKQ